MAVAQHRRRCHAVHIRPHRFLKPRPKRYSSKAKAPKCAMTRSRARKLERFRVLDNGMLDPRPRGECVEIMQRNVEESFLLRLPAEIRNHIFQYVLGGQKVAIHSPSYYRPHGTEEKGDSDFAISQFKDPYIVLERARSIRPVEVLVTCRQIYSETVLLPFALNTFSFTSEMEVLDIKHKVFEAQLHAVTAVQFCAIRGALQNQDGRIKAMSYLPSLKKVYINIYFEESHTFPELETSSNHSDQASKAVTPADVEATKRNMRTLEDAVRQGTGGKARVIFTYEAAEHNKLFDGTA
ncbi:hypothetical protein BDV96DRAFT_382848 [Lophiotrema nucula]|uniref:DUF7730 domain-containing protein n=1 Tax=Lophiotrema nucula TaxID=690887 RepID=A0A6A5ZIT7_9PLEO|nr:hypothetical protein BDV96DRAFT_382848 [Lophiotrema nucula]